MNCFQSVEPNNDFFEKVEVGRRPEEIATLNLPLTDGRRLVFTQFFFAENPELKSENDLRMICLKSEFSLPFAPPTELKDTTQRGRVSQT